MLCCVALRCVMYTLGVCALDRNIFYSNDIVVRVRVGMNVMFSSLGSETENACRSKYRPTNKNKESMIGNRVCG